MGIRSENERGLINMNEWGEKARLRNNRGQIIGKYGVAVRDPAQLYIP